MTNETRKQIVTIVDYDPNCDDHSIVTNYEFDDIETAMAFLHWSWEDWFNSDETEDIDEENSFHEETYGILKHYNGWKTEWFAYGSALRPPKEFLKVAEWYKM